MCTDWHGAAPAKSICQRFHIPDDWSVLIVKDDEDRILWFRTRVPKAVVANDVEAAIHALSKQEFKVTFLDHDLHWTHIADNTIFKGTGKEVAQFMAKQGVKGIVIIRSRHEEGAAMMKKFLPRLEVVS
jgi:hypothetical protein